MKSLLKQYRCTGRKKISQRRASLCSEPTRAGVHPAKFLEGFVGYVICDGYDAYNAVKGAKRCGCWTHTRRCFAEALPKDQSAYSTTVAAKAVRFCDSIYHEEKKLAELTATERYEQRLVKVKPLLDAFFAWLEKQYRARIKMQCNPLLDHLYSSGKWVGCREIPD